jgi:4-amino-4-deoxy-L-arabinose transferase-like glycosyltransferase
MDHIQVSLRRLIRNPLVLLGAFLTGVALFTVYVIGPVPTNVYGDFTDGSYWQAIDAVEFGTYEPYFLPNRITTGMGLILATIAGGHIFGSREFTWMLLSVISYVGMSLFFYLLAKRVTGSVQAALLSTIIVAFNYGALVWGLNYTADGMGWFFFIAALYFSFRFLEGGGKKWIWWAVASVAIGAIFKEYAPCAYLAIAASIALWQGYSWPKKILLVGLTGVACLVPFLAANFYSYLTFHYTYLDWWHYNHTNQVQYPGSYFEEYVKILGGIYTFMWFVFIPGAVIFWKRKKELFSNRALQYILVAALASLPVFIWPPFQRIFFITVPAFALVCGLYFARIKYPSLFWIVPLLCLYILSGYTMDAYILPNINIQPILHLIFK